MSIYFYGLIIIMLFFSCNGRTTYKDEINVNGIINSIIIDNPETYKSDCKLLQVYTNKFCPPGVYNDNIQLVEHLSEYFDSEEIEYLLHQRKNLQQNEIQINDNNLNFSYCNITTMDSILSTKDTSNFNYWTVFEQQVGCLQVFSLPLISKNNEFAIIRYSVIHGSLSAWGFTSIYQLRNRKWEEIKLIEFWQS